MVNCWEIRCSASEGIRGTWRTRHATCAVPSTIADSYGVGWFTSWASIESLPDNVLFDIFSFYRLAVMRFRDCAWDWHTLAHVCHRWRRIILTSPHLLDLRLTCTERTPVVEMLDAFPTFPIIIDYQHNAPPPYHISQDWGNIFAALGHRDQARWISLSRLTSRLLGVFVTMMQKPFPALTFLELRSDDGIDEMVQVLPDTFLGRSAPRLQYLILQGVPFPALPALLFSASDLLSLHLTDIPSTGYISPEALATGLSTLPRLTWLRITFASPTPSPDRTGQQRSPPPMCAVLSSLTFLAFRGTNEYLEDLVAQIRAPCLNLFNVQFFDQLLFDVPQLLRFISRSKKLRSPKRSTVSLYYNCAKIVFGPREGTVGSRHFSLRVLCEGSNRQVSSVTQICNQSSALLSKVKRLDVKGNNCLQPGWQDGMNNAQWLDLLRPFVAVERLHISERLAPLVLPALQGLTGEKTTAVLPALDNLSLEGLIPTVSLREEMVPFITARHLLGRYLAIRWGDREYLG